MKFLVYVEVECRTVEDGKSIIESALQHRREYSGGIEPLKMNWIIMPSTGIVGESGREFERRFNKHEGD